jgi:hypothetical protein
MVRPAVLFEATRLDLRMPAALISEVDFWRSRQPSLPNRSEALRRLIEIGLRVFEAPPGAETGGTGSDGNQTPPAGSIVSQRANAG